MTDPAFLLLLQHLNRPAPAITEVAPLELSAPGAARYEAYISAQEQKLERWIARGYALRERLWTQAAAAGSGVSRDMLSSMITRFEMGLRLEAKTLMRTTKRAARDEKQLVGRDRTVIAELHRRLLRVARRFYEEGLDFASYLRALRAELDETTRGGASYDDAAGLERGLLADLRTV